MGSADFEGGRHGGVACARDRRADSVPVESRVGVRRRLCKRASRAWLQQDGRGFGHRRCGASGSVGRSGGQESRRARRRRRGVIPGPSARMPLPGTARGPAGVHRCPRADIPGLPAWLRRRSARSASVVRGAWVGERLLRLDGAPSWRHAGDAGEFRSRSEGTGGSSGRGALALRRGRIAGGCA